MSDGTLTAACHTCLIIVWVEQCFIVVYLWLPRGNRPLTCIHFFADNQQQHNTKYRGFRGARKLSVCLLVNDHTPLTTWGFFFKYYFPHLYSDILFYILYCNFTTCHKELNPSNDVLIDCYWPMNSWVDICGVTNLSPLVQVMVCCLFAQTKASFLKCPSQNVALISDILSKHRSINGY